MPLKLSIARTDLVAAAGLVGRAVSSRATLPALGGIQLDAGERGLTLRATDLELSLTREAGGTIESPGTVLLPARLFGDVVRALPEGPVTLVYRSDQRDVELSAAAARFHLRTLAGDDFPRLPQLDGDTVSLPASPLARTIELVARAASRDEVRPILTGVLVVAEESTLTMVATDSYRLSVKHSQLDELVAARLEANVPAKALRELARIAVQEGAERVDIALGRNQVVCHLGAVTLSSRLIEGQFPSWRQLIPESFEHEVRLSKAEFLEITRRIGQLAQRNAPLRLAFAEGELTVAAETPEIGDASEALPAPYGGEPMEIAFNPQFLIEGIESIEGDEVVLRLSSPLRPGLLQPAAADDFSYLVMPIRLNV